MPGIVDFLVKIEYNYSRKYIQTESIELIQFRQKRYGIQVIVVVPESILTILCFCGGQSFPITDEEWHVGFCWEDFPDGDLYEIIEKWICGSRKAWEK